MTIGSTANIAFAFTALKQSGPHPLSPVERLALILIGDAFGMGAAKVSVSKFHQMLGTDDPLDAQAALSALAAKGLIRLSQFRDGEAYAASSIATEREIATARDYAACDWPFHNWAGTT